MSGAESSLNRAASVDANATAPVHPAAWEAYARTANCADPRAEHPAGLAARAELAAARTAVATFLGAPAASTIHFTSGGTEADALALAHVPPGGHLVTSSIEHAAVGQNALRAHADIVPVGRHGRVDPQAIIAALRPDTAMVSLVLACNETGILQPIAEVGQALRARGVLLHTDAVQAMGRVPIDLASLPVDLLSFSGHKVGAVGGIGGLYVRPGLPTTPLLPDRPDNVPGAVSLAAALQQQPDAARLAAWTARRQAFETALRTELPQIEILGAQGPRLPNTSSIRFPGVEGEALLMALDIGGFAISTGSACSSGSIDPSPILLGMGLSAREARETVRFSFPEDFLDLESLLRLLIATVRSASRTRLGC